MVRAPAGRAEFHFVLVSCVLYEAEAWQELQMKNATKIKGEQQPNPKRDNCSWIEEPGTVPAAEGESEGDNGEKKTGDQVQ